MYKIRYFITAESPLLFTVNEGDGNMVSSLDYIPGSAMRGFFAGEYIRKKNLYTNNAHLDTDFYDWFLNEGLIFTPGYLVVNIENKQYNLLPTPLFLQKLKKEEEGLNLLKMKPEDKTENSLPVLEFWTLVGDQVLKRKPEMEMHFHIQRNIPSDFNRNRIKSKEEEKEIFNYQALRRGQVFGGYIQGEETKLKQFMSLFDNKKMPAYLGRSRTTEYGRVNVEILPIEKNAADELIIFNEENTCLMILTSPLILYNEYGYPNISIQALEDYLNKLAGTFKVEIMQSFARTYIRESFVSHWKLRKPADHVMIAGSSFVLSFSGGDLSEYQNFLKVIRKNGIGFCRGEGFGQVNILSIDSDLIPQERFFSFYDEKEFIDLPDVNMPTTARKVFCRIIERILNDTFVHEGMQDAEYYFDSLTGKPDDYLSSHLIGRLEMMLEGSDTAAEFINKIELLRATALDKLKKLNDQNITLLDKLKRPSEDLIGEIMNLAGYHKIKEFMDDNNIAYELQQNTREHLYKVYWTSFFRALRDLNKSRITEERGHNDE